MAENTPNAAVEFPDLDGDSTPSTPTPDAPATDATTDTTTDPPAKGEEGDSAALPPADALTIDPEATYLGPDGQPLRGSEMLAGIMRHADYTQKTQAAAEALRTAEQRLEEASTNEQALSIGQEFLTALSDPDSIDEIIDMLETKKRALSGDIYESEGEKHLAAQLAKANAKLEELTKATPEQEAAKLHESVAKQFSLTGETVTAEEVKTALAMFPALAAENPMLAVTKAVQVRSQAKKPDGRTRVPSGTNADISPKAMSNDELWDTLVEKQPV